MDLIKYIKGKSLPIKVNTLLIGVSGGVDSTVLLHILLPLAGHYDWELVVMHLNHGLRKSADKDEKFVKDLANSLGLKFISKTTDVKKVSQAKKLTIEEAGRMVRYEFFKNIAKKYPSSVIVTAHTADDQVETIIMNWLRGTLVRGLSGMRELDKNIWRPLLDVSKKDLIKFAGQYGIRYREDKSNKKFNYTRNKIRHQLLPVLLKFNPNLNKTLLRNAKLFSNLESFLDETLEQTYFKVKDKKTKDKVSLSRTAFMKLHTFMQDELLLYSIGLIKGDRQDFKQVHSQEIRKVLLNNKKESNKQLPGKLFLIKTYDKITISRNRPKDL